MTNIGSNISWCDSTWGLAIGCTKVSAGCDNCYAETLVNLRPATFRQKFDEVRLRLERLADIRKFKPMRTERGLRPHMVFVNSLSDFWHDAIPDDVIFRCLDVMEEHPTIVFQILTKRPVRARKLLVQRYGGLGIPRHIWVGVTVEGDEVAKRLDIWRTVKQRVGAGTFFVSAEPLIGTSDKLNFTDMNWVIIGGESGPRARRMSRHALVGALEAAAMVGSAVWLKQHGTIGSHPNLDQAPHHYGVKGKFAWLVENGWELLPDEKGGATIDKSIFRELPEAFEHIKAAMNPTGLL